MTRSLGILVVVVILAVVYFAYDSQQNAARKHTLASAKYMPPSMVSALRSQIACGRTR
jgi:hypothetical protein